MIQEYKEASVAISFNEPAKTIMFDGEMRHASLMEFKPTRVFLWSLIPKIQEMKTLVIDIERLEYLNSSGQATINMFVLELKREAKNLSITIKGTHKFEWQSKFLHTTKQLWGNSSTPMLIEIS